MELRFRPTVLPGQAVPRIPAVGKVSYEDGWLFFDRPVSYVDVPSEVYIREFRDTDPADVEQLAQLCSIGLICPLTKAPFLADLPVEWSGVTWNEVEPWPQLASVARQFGLPRETGDEAERGKRRRAVGDAVHVAEVALRVWYVQQCTDHLLAYAAGEPVWRAWRRGWRDRGDPYVDLDLLAWAHFTEATNAALRDFHVRVTVERPATPGPTEESTIGGVYTTLYSAAMLQLVNDLAEEVPYLRCANETCGRLFARQRGRAEHGGNRMRGVLYCSNTCARAQYQREKRRRDRAARNGGKR